MRRIPFREFIVEQIKLKIQNSYCQFFKFDDCFIYSEEYLKSKVLNVPNDVFDFDMIPFHINEPNLQGGGVGIIAIRHENGAYWFHLNPNLIQYIKDGYQLYFDDNDLKIERKN